MKWSLSRQVSLAVLASARTEADHHEDLGCSILGPASRPVRRAHAALKRTIQQLGADQASRRAPALVRWLESTPRYAALTRGRSRRAGRRLLRDEVLFPDAQRQRPRVLHVRREALGLDVPVRELQWPAFNALWVELAQGVTAARLRQLRAHPVVGELVERLGQAGCLQPHAEPLKRSGPGALFIGHHTVLMRGRTGAVLVDPYFRPASALDLPGYQPLQPSDLGPIDAVLITHSHGDHFHLGSLLQLPRDTPIFVPPVERESLFSTDCALRLSQLGFTRVEPLGWWHSRQVKDLSVQALPFFGEQPTAGEGVYPGLWNEGSTWVVRGPVSAAFFADSGADVRGSMRQVCRRVRQGGPVDWLFCGVRGFALKPIFFSFTTLDAYLVNVPLPELTRPQHLMADGPEALELARLLGASTLVPCADGGAPWYWREGMGPKYPGFPGQPVVGASSHDEHPDADPYPERVAALAGDRGVKVTVLRPGEGLDGRGRVERHPGFAWPFEPLQP